MLKKGYLTTIAFYATYSHNIAIIDKYLNEIEIFMLKYKKDMEENNIKQYLEGPVCHGGFQRVN